MRISETLLVQYVDGAGLVIVDESSGQESEPIIDIEGFAKQVKEEAIRGVDPLDVDGILIGGQAIANLFVALAYFAGVAPHPSETGQFSAADFE